MAVESAAVNGAMRRGLRAAVAAAAISSSLLLPASALAAPPASAAAPASASHVFLVQNSGWMEPFYSDPSSPYKALVTEVLLAAVQPGDALVLASFNQSLPGAPSPKALLSTRIDAKPPRARVQGALAKLGTATKPGSTALADTDLGEAVGAAMKTALAGKPGLVWLFTNNKNSPNNDQATARRNREFYELIHHGDAIKKALAFPLHMPVRGVYQANGLMIYVLAIDDGGARQLDALLRSGRLQRVITEAPARLKPLDRDTVRMLPVKVENVPGVTFSTLPGGTLRADVDAGESGEAPAAARIQWRLENAIYPYTIASASLSAHSVLAGEEKPISMAGGDITALAPGKSQPLASAMQLPVAHLPGKWSFEAIRAAGSAYSMPGKIEVQLSEQKLELSDAFRQRMATLFPGDPLPDIFTPPPRIDGSTAVLPLEVRMRFGIAPLLALIGAVLAVLALAAALLVAFTRPRKVQLTVEGELRTLYARTGTRQPVHDRAGNKVAELKTGWFGHTLTDLREGAQVRLGA